ncbi:MAG: HAD family hydrolase [Patescibacteria group bacterium]
MVKVISFDLWKTLAGEPRSTGDVVSLLQRYGSALSEKDLRLAIKDSMMRRKVSPKAGMTMLAKRSGIRSEKLVEELIQLWRFSCDQSFLYPEVLPVLARLRKNYKLSLITNTSWYGWQAIEKRYRLSQYFDYLVLSYEAGFVKPEREVFEMVQKEFCVPAQSILMVGDSRTSDFLPTKALGWQALLVDRSGKTAGAIRTIKEVQKSLAQYH